MTECLLRLQMVHAHELEIQCTDRTWRFRASSNRDRDMWIAAIQLFTGA